MSLETPKVPKPSDRVESPVHQGAQEHDPLQAYRMERPALTPGAAAPKDFLNMHDLWKPSVASPFNTPGLAAPEAAAKAQNAAPTADSTPANHVVGNNESLWKIAGDALRASTHNKPNNSEIWKSVQDIVAANKQDHPELGKNPDAINPGMKLHLPEELAAKPEAPKAETAKGDIPKTGEAPKTDEAKVDAAGDPIKLADAHSRETGDHGGPAAQRFHGRHHHPKRTTEGEAEHPPHHHRPERGHEGEGPERHPRHHRRHGGGGGRGSRRRRRHPGHEARVERPNRRHEQPEVEGEDTEKPKSPSDSKPNVKPGTDGQNDPKVKPGDATTPGADGKPGDKDQKPDHDNPLTHAFKELGKGLGDLADKVARMIHTKNNCAIGPRLTFEKLGYILPHLIATKQGAELERSGLFTEVPRDQVQPGDYAYRHWNSQVIKQHHGVDKGDAFIVSGVGKHGELYGSNDHRFVVPEDGGRYRNTKFLRPTAKFWELYGPKS